MTPRDTEPFGMIGFPPNRRPRVKRILRILLTAVVALAVLPALVILGVRVRYGGGEPFEDQTGNKLVHIEHSGGRSGSSEGEMPRMGIGS